MDEYQSLCYLRQLTTSETIIPKVQDLVLANFCRNQPEQAREGATGVRRSYWSVTKFHVTNKTRYAYYKFHGRPVEVGGDMEKMIHQICINNENQEAQRCLRRIE